VLIRALARLQFHLSASIKYRRQTLSNGDTHLPDFAVVGNCFCFCRSAHTKTCAAPKVGASRIGTRVEAEAMRLAWHSFVCKLRSCIGCDSVSGQAEGELTTAASAAHITKDTYVLTPAHVGYKYLRNTDIRAVDADGNFTGASYDQQENDVEQDDSGSEVHLNPGKVSQDFLPQWEEEFLESEYQVEVFPRLLLWVFAAVSIVSVFGLIAPAGSQPEDCWGHGALDMLQVRTMYASGMLWPWFKKAIVEEPEVVIGILRRSPYIYIPT
jgi:hypothetical protein